MRILVLIILNVGIVVLLATAFFLLRRPRGVKTVRRAASATEPTPRTTEDRSDRRRRPRRGRGRRAIDIRGRESREPRDQPDAGVVEEGVEQYGGGGTTGDERAATARHRAMAAPADSLDLRVDGIGRAPVEMPAPGAAPTADLAAAPRESFRSSGEMFAVDRPALLERDPSRIRLVRDADAGTIERAALVGGIMRTLGGIGLDPAEIDGRRSRLATPDGRRAAINVNSLDDGADVIDIIVDASLGADALRALIAWHRSDLDRADDVRISAWID